METSSPSIDPTLRVEPLLRRIVTLLGWISLFATLALLSPGCGLHRERRRVGARGRTGVPRRARGRRARVAELEQMLEALRGEAAVRDDRSSGVRVAEHARLQLHERLRRRPSRRTNSAASAHRQGFFDTGRGTPLASHRVSGALMNPSSTLRVRRAIAGLFLAWALAR
jgi:hypothetical protein